MPEFLAAAEVATGYWRLAVRYKTCVGLEDLEARWAADGLDCVFGSYMRFVIYRGTEGLASKESRGLVSDEKERHINLTCNLGMGTCTSQSWDRRNAPHRNLRALGSRIEGVRNWTCGLSPLSL